MVLGLERIQDFRRYVNHRGGLQLRIEGKRRKAEIDVSNRCKNPKITKIYIFSQKSDAVKTTDRNRPLNDEDEKLNKDKASVVCTKKLSRKCFYWHQALRN